MKKVWFVSLLIMLTSAPAGATEIANPRTVCNPGLNECVKVFEGTLTENTRLSENIPDELVAEARKKILHWIYEGHEAAYLRDFDSSNFYFQFVQKNTDSPYLGIVLIIPEAGIGDDFYTELAAGLEVPGTRCVNANWAWVNDGEIFSWVYNTTEKSLMNFRNWRFEQEKDTGIDPLAAYYSLLTIHYKCKTDKAEETTIVHFVNGEARDEIPAWENFPVMLPKGKVSTLVFYCNGQIKGVLCFDMTDISRGCPLRYESTVYMKERLGYERILYTKPKCEGIYEVSIMEKESFEELTGLIWNDLSDFKEDVAFN